MATSRNKSTTKSGSMPQEVNSPGPTTGSVKFFSEHSSLQVLLSGGLVGQFRDRCLETGDAALVEALRNDPACGRLFHEGKLPASVARKLEEERSMVSRSKDAHEHGYVRT